MKSLLGLVLAAAVTAFAGASAAFPIASTGDGLTVLVTSTDDVIATYEGNSAAFSNDLYLVQDTGDVFIFNNHDSTPGDTVNLGSFSVGTELLFRLFVNDTGYDYFTGPATRNPDSSIHARVQSNWQPGTTLVSFEDLYEGPFEFNDLSFSFTNTISSGAPEPGTWALLVGGFGAIGGAIRRQRRTVAVQA